LKRSTKEAELAYCIAYPYKNKGFASLAVQKQNRMGVYRATFKTT